MPVSVKKISLHTILLSISFHEIAQLLHFLYLWLLQVPAVEQLYRNIRPLAPASHFQSVVTFQ
jgi:hypothetical protein